MDLLDIRKQFVKLSGRYDLIDDDIDWSDNGADFYIQAGQKYLDRLVTVPENTATIYLPLNANSYSLTFQYSCRSIRDVYVNNSETRTRLEKVSLNDLKIYYENLVSEITTNTPLYYALADLRALKTSSKNTLGTFVNLTHEESETKYDYRGIILMPPADEAFIVEISGLFLQNNLTVDTDNNWWTDQAPDLLIKAALYQLEVFSRGTENAKNWSRAIQAEVVELEKDFIDEEIVDVDAMKG